MTLRIFVLIAAIVQIVFPIFVNPFRDGGRGLASVGPPAVGPSQIEPAGYAFAIWGPIYLLAVAYAAWQLTRSGRADPATARAAPYALVVYAGSSVWLTLAAFGPVWMTMPVLGVMAACACVALIAASAMPAAAPWRFWAMTIPFGLYAGWTTCATFVNIAEVAPRYGFVRFGFGVTDYAIGSIVAATVVVAAILVMTRGAIGYAAAVVWALVAIAVAAQARGYPASVIVASLMAVAAVVIVTLLVRRGGATRAAGAVET